MITLAEFLYLEDIDEAQSKNLLADPTLGSISFESPTQFRDFFAKSNIILKKQTTNVLEERRILLERFKSFKSSSDYAIAKNFIAEQAKLKKELERINNLPAGSVTIETITNVLNGLSAEPADPFFGFIIRKILTGSDNGILPSESLREMLNTLLKQNTQESYDETSDVIRDDQQRIIDFQNLYKNKGRLRVPILDDRFIVKDFKYIIDSSFTSLPDATLAEKNVISKLLDIANSSDPSSGGFINSLSQLILEDSNSVVGLNAKIKMLQDEIAAKQETIDLRINKEIEHEQFIDSIATDNLQKEIQLETKDKAIQDLSNTIDDTLKKIEDNVNKQLSEIPSAFDALSAKLDEQSKLAEEQAKAAQDAAAAQLEAFQKAMSGLADSVKSKTSNPSTGSNNPAAADIDAIAKMWDSIYAITYSPSTELDLYLNSGGPADSTGLGGGGNGNAPTKTTYPAVYTAFKSVLDLLGITEPPISDYVFAPPSNSNQTLPGKELKQLINWNQKYKDQFKASVYSLKDATVSGKIKTAMQSISNSKAVSPATLREVISNLLTGWVNDIGKSRLVGVSYIKDAAHELDPLFKWTTNAENSSIGAAYMANAIRAKIPTGNTENDANKLLNVMNILDGISTVVDKNSGWV